jgi:hypothetical protein
MPLVETMRNQAASSVGLMEVDPFADASVALGVDVGLVLTLSCG